MELIAYQAYRNPELEISCWRTSTGYEVDFILGQISQENRSLNQCSSLAVFLGSLVEWKSWRIV
jgi:hypothetical protein